MADPTTNDPAPGPGQQEGLGRAVTALTDPTLDVSAAPRFRDPLLDAMSVIGSRMGSPVRPPNTAVERGVSATTAALASSGWLAWQTRLDGRWWGKVSVPMLVTAEDRPAAVLSRRSRTVLIGAVDRRTTRINRGNAAQVSPDAYAIVPDLPADSRWFSLVRWSLRRQRRSVLVFLGLAILGGLAALILPVTTAAVFQVAIPQGNRDLAAWLLVAFALASAGAAIVALARGYAVVRIRDRMDSALAPGVMVRLLRLRAPFFRSHSVGEIANRVAAIEEARDMVDDATIAMIATSAFGLVSIAYLFVAGVALGLITTLVVVLVLAVSVNLKWRARAQLPRLLDNRSRTDALLLSLLQGLVNWRVSGAEDRALAEWAARQRASTSAFRDRLRAVSLSPLLETAGPGLVLTVFTVSVVLLPGDILKAGSPTAPGAFLAMYAAVVQVTIAMLALSSSLMALSEYGPTFSRCTPILTAPVEPVGTGDHPGPLSGQVALDRVTFGYVEGHTPLFDDLSLSVAPGEFVACVGPSGSGKSTILRLLLGFEQPWTGSVRYDSLDLSTLDPGAVRRQTGVVLQSSQPLGRTIRECVTGARELTDDAVWSLLDHAGLADDVAAMPAGLHTPMGDQGATVSGGQRQRLMIAAALAGDPRILLFDEATSALDNLSQSVVMRTILSSRATRVVIAHRLSTIQRADRVIVISRGRVEEAGPPDELLRSGGMFARLAARQEL